MKPEEVAEVRLLHTLTFLICTAKCCKRLGARRRGFRIAINPAASFQKPKKKCGAASQLREPRHRPKLGTRYLLLVPWAWLLRVPDNLERCSTLRHLIGL